MERGEAHVALGFPAKLAAVGEGLFPSLIAHVMRAVNALLPKGHDQRAKAGKDSASFLAPSILTIASDRAAVRNNET